MRTTLMKWISLSVLFLAFVSWSANSNYEFLVRLVVCAGASVVAVQAYRAAKLRWMAGFLVIAVLFNPAISAFRLGGAWGLLTIVFAAASFAVSLSALKSQPLLSIPSITDRNPGSESL